MLQSTRIRLLLHFDSFIMIQYPAAFPRCGDCALRYALFAGQLGELRRENKTTASVVMRIVLV